MTPRDIESIVRLAVKDRDLMSDTGGTSKHRNKSTLRPPRDYEMKSDRAKLMTKETRTDLVDDVKADPDLKA